MNKSEREKQNPDGETSEKGQNKANLAAYFYGNEVELEKYGVEGGKD